MSPGKMTAMAGHCFVNTILTALEDDKHDLITRYQGPDFIGTKVCLKAKGLPQILNTYERAMDAGLPCALITDQGHIHPPHFTGEPIIVGMGIGPALRDQTKFLRKFNCFQ